MPGFKRYYRQFPGYDELLSIESVNVIDQRPLGAVRGAGVGCILLVGEFEDGSFNTPTQVFGGSDIKARFGGFGYRTSNSPSDGPIAQRSGGNEAWNGNGFVWLRNKKFAKLVLCRVDSSAGSVEFRRCATLVSTIKGAYILANNATITFERNGSLTSTVTFTGTRSQLDGTGGTFPTVFIGGETLELKVDEDDTKVITFTAADQAIADVVSRINATLAATIGSNNAGQLRLNGVIEGWRSRIQVVGGTARATLGLPTAAAAQQSTLTVTAAGIGTWTASVTTVLNGVSTVWSVSYTATGADTTTTIRDALLARFQTIANGPVRDNEGVITFVASAANIILVNAALNARISAPSVTPGGAGTATFTITTAGTFTVQRGTGNVGNVANVSTAEAASVIDAVANLRSDVTSDGFLRVMNDGTPATGTLRCSGGTHFATLGFDTATLDNAASGEDVTIPAGTRVQDSTATGTVWVTMRSIDTGTGGGPFTVQVRPFTDTDTALSSTASNVTLILDTLPDGFVVTNPAGIARLSSTQLDARYLEAIDATLDDNTDGRFANVIASARTSPTIQTALRQNALSATQAGLAARKAVSRPRIGTSRDDARAITGQGVGVNRDERFFYLFPGVTHVIPEILAVGARGGVGFSDDGIVQVGADSWYCSVRSILNPEEDAGQKLNDTDVGGLPILALEDAYNKDKGGVSLTIDDYKSFKANGIIAGRISRTSGFVFQSDVTSVLPSQDLELADANRRFFGDYLIDSYFDIALPFVKKLQSTKRRLAYDAKLRGFHRGLAPPGQPDAQRLAGFEITDQTTQEQRDQGLDIKEIRVKMLSTFKSMVLNVEVGTTVTITEAAA